MPDTICRQSDCEFYDTKQRNHCRTLGYVPRERECEAYSRIEVAEGRVKKAKRKSDDSPRD